MHFSIPDTQDLKECKGSGIVGYNVHINGIYHCTVRYKQLHILNEQLKGEFGHDNLPLFPSKKLLPLSSGQVEERRMLLEKYIQALGQDVKFMTSTHLCGFLLAAQQETFCSNEKEVNLDIFIMATNQIKVKVSTFDSTGKVLAKALRQVNLPLDYIQYFSLYLIKVDNSGDIVVLRKFLNFESPYITQQVMRIATRIVIRKNYWDMKFDKELMTDPVALNLLYLQTLSDVERGWIIAMREPKIRLEKLKLKLAKKEYIEFAQKLKYYGFLQFSQCYCDYPHSGTKVSVAIGDEELSIRIVGPGNLAKEGVFKVTRMRCWRITATNDKRDITQESSTYSNNVQPNSNLELSFEYLMSKDNLRWITISSAQAILMSVCLQSLVDELLLKKNGVKKQDNNTFNGKWTYMKRDGSCHLMCNHTNLLDSSDDPENIIEGRNEELFSIKTLQDKFSSVSFKNGREFVENQAFEGISNDDL
ncbi:sorting nexin-17 [Euwallacea similis]|uniref:sorting nexin-17 n=1 Tax=Euwallacea similis TaxID=1736056 RepID=UPI00344B14C6